MCSIEFDYIFEADVLREACRQSDLRTDYALSEWEMLLRLCVGDVEVLGRSDEDYHAWLKNLRRYNVALHIPSPAWSRLSVLWIASSVESAFARLREEGHSDLDSLDCAIHLVQQDDMVTVFLSRDRVGQAPMAEMYAAFAAFAERVRRDWLAICPQLTDHVTLGPWFRGEGESPEVPSEPILL